MNIFSHRRTRGFTLIELLVVISIIGLLSSIVLASLNSSRQKAYDARRISDIRQLRNALALYSTSNGGKYPTDLSLLVPTYISVLPKDPKADGSTCRATVSPYYCYFAPADGSYYHVGARLQFSGNILNSGSHFDDSGSGGFNGTSANDSSTNGYGYMYDVKL